MLRLLPVSVLFLAVLAAPAFAKSKDKEEDNQSDDDDAGVLKEEEKGPSEDDFKEEDEDDAPAPPKLAPDTEEEEGEPEDDDFSDPGEEDELEFKDEEEEDEDSVKPQGPGEDTARIYRDAEAEYREESAEEELISWEQYLKKYPKSLFRDRIEQRMEELSGEMYSQRVPGSDRGERNEDAAERELTFMTPVRMASVDTRQKLAIQAQWGYPSWVGFGIDYEHALWREFSVHGGLTRDLTGLALNVGAKYDILKSSRTGTILGVALDVKGNTVPGFAGIEPAILFGQRLPVMAGLDLQVAGSADMEFRDPFGIRWNSGLAAELHPNQVVSIYVETDAYVKHASSNDVTFHFVTAVFGLRFTPIVGDKEGHKRVELGLAADAPYTYQYWGFYRGGVDIIGNYYF